MFALDSFHLSFPASRFPSHGLTRPRANLRATIAVPFHVFSSLPFSHLHSIRLSFSSSLARLPAGSSSHGYCPRVVSFFRSPQDHSRLLIHQRERIRDVRREKIMGWERDRGAAALTSVSEEGGYSGFAKRYEIAFSSEKPGGLVGDHTLQSRSKLISGDAVRFPRTPRPTEGFERLENYSRSSRQSDSSRYSPRCKVTNNVKREIIESRVQKK